MEIYETEEQQVEAIKSFWSEYGNQIILGVVVGLGGLYGYNTYKDSQREAEAEAAQAFAVAEQVEQLQTFVNDYSSSSYTGLAEMKLAKTQVAAGELENAAKTLSSLIASGNTPAGVEEIARIRLARLNIELGNLDAAIDGLKGDWSNAVTTEVNTILGDALMKKADLSGAREAYQKAILAAQPGSNTSIIQMRLDDLAEPAPVLTPVGE